MGFTHANPFFIPIDPRNTKFLTQVCICARTLTTNNFLSGFSLSTSMATVFHRNPVGDRVDALRKWFVPSMHTAFHPPLQLAYILCVPKHGCRSDEKRALVLERMARILEVQNPAEQNEVLSIETIKQMQVIHTTISVVMFSIFKTHLQET